VDPYAWLKPMYAQLRANPAFARLAPVSQFLELCRAAHEQSPRKAEMASSGAIGAPEASV
jgi:hypothetical protein